jgi:prophage regulatory protein
MSCMQVHYSAKQQSVDPAALLRLKQVLELVPVCASSWWAGVKSGRFPRPVKLGRRTTCWRASDVLALIERAAAGEGGNDRR